MIFICCIWILTANSCTAKPFLQTHHPLALIGILPKIVHYFRFCTTNSQWTCINMRYFIDFSRVNIYNNTTVVRKSGNRVCYMHTKYTIGDRRAGTTDGSKLSTAAMELLLIAEEKEKTKGKPNRWLMNLADVVFNFACRPDAAAKETVKAGEKVMPSGDASTRSGAAGDGWTYGFRNFLRLWRKPSSSDLASPGCPPPGFNCGEHNH